AAIDGPTLCARAQRCAPGEDRHVIHQEVQSPALVAIGAERVQIRPTRMRTRLRSTQLHALRGDAAMMRGTRAATLGLASAAAALMITGGTAAAAAVPAAPPTAIPQLAPAEPGTLAECESLIAFEHGSTVITGAELVAAGTLSGVEVGEHCLVR